MFQSEVDSLKSKFRKNVMIETKFWFFSPINTSDGKKCNEDRTSPIVCVLSESMIFFFFPALSCASFEVENGTVNCTNEFFYDSECQVTCTSGFIIQPSNFSATTCLQNLTWSVMPPTCLGTELRVHYEKRQKLLENNRDHIF